MLQGARLGYHRHLLAYPGHSSKLRLATVEQRRPVCGDAQLGHLTLWEELNGSVHHQKGLPFCRECASREPETGLYTTPWFHHLEIRMAKVLRSWNPQGNPYS